MKDVNAFIIAAIVLVAFPFVVLIGGLMALWDVFKKLKPQVGKLGVLPDPSLVLALWVAMIAVLLGYIMTVIQFAPVLFR